MVRKLIPLLLLLLLPIIAFANGQVVDEAGLFSDADIRDMEQIMDRIEREHQVDLAVLATRNVPTDYSESLWKVRDYADDYYDRGGFGMGEDFSGMLILLDMNNRVIWLSTGGVMMSYINDSREEAIIDEAYYYLTSGQYGKAMIAALRKTESFMNRGREEGTFLYDEVTGQRIGGIYNALTSGEIGVAAVAGGAVALVIFLSVSGAYNLKGSTYSYDRASNSSIVLTRDDEQYLRQYVRRTPRNTGTHGGMSSSGGVRRSGGSGVHRSSGGRSHGGGGRRF